MATIPVGRINCDFQGFSTLSMLYQQIVSNRDIDSLDFSQCNFFQADMSAPFAVLLEKAAHNWGKRYFLRFPDNKVREALLRNGFLVRYGGSQIPDHFGTTIPFTNFNVDEIRKFKTYLDEVLNYHGTPEMTAALKGFFLASLFEVFSNVKNHAESSLGLFACGQEFRSKQKLCFTISDAGVGIQTTVQNRLSRSMSASEAIAWALQEGNTVNEGHRPGGIGLKFIKKFVNLNMGELIIVSGNGYYGIRRGNISYSILNHPLPGTTVSLTINTADQNSYCLESELGEKL